MGASMSRALLLSPDDQAVTAITTVLEEMAVSCERPLDGVSAAQKLNSHNFDLVLVDCENLPAAKLIFDVCRRGKAGQSPVPIAIVDGRAGLPTAFRLGAELILTKPVSMDHVRSTIRTAVGRLRREDPAHMAAPADNIASDVDSPQEQAAAAAAAASMSVPTPAPVAPQMIESTPSDVAPVEASTEVPSPTLQASAAVKESPVPIAPPKTETGFAFAPLSKRPVDPLPALKTEPEEKVPDVPALAKFDKQEAVEVPSPAPVLSSFTVPRPSPVEPKRRGGQVAVLILLIVGGGAYAAWMYQPQFRQMVQPQVERVMALAGRQPAAKPQLKAPVPQPAATSAATSTTPAMSPSDQVPANSANAAPATPDTQAASAPVPAAALGKAASSATESKPVASAAPINEPAASPADSSNPTRTVSLANPPEMDKNVVILSSKGAEKRLIAKVSPVYPAEAKASGIEGTVVLKVLVSDTGKVEKVSPADGDPTLAKAGIRAVKQWRYRPYVRDGKDLPFQTVVILDFQRK